MIIMFSFSTTIFFGLAQFGRRRLLERRADFLADRFRAPVRTAIPAAWPCDGRRSPEP